MKKTLNFSQFYNDIWEERKNQFSYEGWKALFEYIEEMEEATGVETECDIIALCCEFTEFDNFADYSSQYTQATTIDEISDYTTFIPIEGTERFIIAQY
jgi:hypothetical protein